MALIICQDCGKEVSSSARKCPHCGRRLKISLGKILLFFLLAIFLIPIILVAINTAVNLSSNNRIDNSITNSEINFEIISINGRWKYGTLYAYGEIKNIGNKALGVQIEVIARDNQDNLIDSQQFWPNSVNNINPGQSVGINYPITEDKRAKKVEAKIITTKSW